MHTLPKLTGNLKMLVSNRNIIFQGAIFRCKLLVFGGVYSKLPSLVTNKNGTKPLRLPDLSDPIHPLMGVFLLGESQEWRCLKIMGTILFKILPSWLGYIGDYTTQDWCLKYITKDLCWKICRQMLSFLFFALDLFGCLRWFFLRSVCTMGWKSPSNPSILGRIFLLHFFPSASSLQQIQVSKRGKLMDLADFHAEVRNMFDVQSPDPEVQSPDPKVQSPDRWQSPDPRNFLASLKNQA